MSKFCAAIGLDKGGYCCGFKEASKYVIGEVTTYDPDPRFDVVHDKYHGQSFVRDGGDYVASGFGETRIEATKACVKKWVEHQLNFIRARTNRTDMDRKGGEAMRMFNIVYAGKDTSAECYTPELRDEVMQIACRKTVMGYYNANSGNYVESIVLVMGEDTTYAG